MVIKNPYPYGLHFPFFFKVYFGEVFLYSLLLSLLPLKAVIHKVTDGVFKVINQSLNLIVIY